MGAITAPMTRAEISDMMTQYAQAGLDQYLFYARGGCSIPFMSDQWLTLCENIVTECARLGISVWLYDEYDCPSGTCAGSLLKAHPEYVCHGLRVQNGTAEHVQGVSYVPMADLLNPACVDEFLACTYEKLYQRLKPYFGTVIKGIFTDEPSMGCTLRRTPDAHPYTPGLEEVYRARFGGDLFSGLAASDPVCLKNYYALLGERFRETYVDRLSAWCRERGVLLTGHLLEESSLRNACVTSGNLLKALRGFGLPGMDEIFDHFSFAQRAEWVTLGTALSARNQNGLLAELGAFGPCDQPLSRYLQMIRLAALFGVDHYIMAVSGADAKGSFVKNQWLHCTNYTQPHFACCRTLGKAAAQAARLAAKQPDFEIAVEYPAGDAASEIDREENTVDPKLYALLEWLIRRQYQWCFVCEDEPAPDGALRVRYDTPFDAILSARPPKTQVLNRDGSLPDELMVRRYADGTVCLLDLRDGGNERRLLLGGKTVTLPARGLYVSSEPLPEYETVKALTASFSVRTDRPNTLRCVFKRDLLTFRFTVREPVTVCAYLRAFKNEACAYLDGALLSASGPCIGLTKGLRELYRQTDPLLLSPGEHEVTLSAYPGDSERFLPCVFLAGDFSMENGLSAPVTHTETGVSLKQALRGFAGVLTFETELDLPAGENLALRADGFELCHRLYLDDVFLGESIDSAAVFPLPSGPARHVRLRIEQYTTIGPVFGSRDALLTPDGSVLYTYYPSVYVNAGIRSLTLLKRL